MMIDEFQSTAANRLNAIADYFGWTPPQLGEILDISQTKAYDALAGRSSVTVSMITVLFSKYKVNPNFFFVAKAPMLLEKGKPAKEEIRVISPATIQEAAEHINEVTRHLQALKKIL